MANRKRRGEDAVDPRLDEALDEDALAEDELVEDEEDLLDEDEEDEDEDDRPARARGNGRSATITKPKTAGAAKKAGPPGKSVKVKDSERRGLVARLVNFVREVVAELRKVIWPTRKELLTYTTVVIIFVTMMFVIVAGLDYGFARAALWVFGGGTK